MIHAYIAKPGPLHLRKMPVLPAATLRGVLEDPREDCCKYRKRDAFARASQEARQRGVNVKRTIRSQDANKLRDHTLWELRYLGRSRYSQLKARLLRVFEVATLLELSLSWFQFRL